MSLILVPSLMRPTIIEGKQNFYADLKANVTSQILYTNGVVSRQENKNGVVPTLTANMGSGGHNVPLIDWQWGD